MEVDSILIEIMMYANWLTLRFPDVKLYYDCFYKIYISNTYKSQSIVIYFNNNFFNIDNIFFI